jgi:hypothetical protein
LGLSASTLTTQSYRDGRRDILLDLDLAEVALAAPEIDWLRQAGRPARARLKLALRNEVLRTIDVMDFAGDGMSLRGRIDFDAAGKLWRDVEPSARRVARPHRSGGFPRAARAGRSGWPPGSTSSTHAAPISTCRRSWPTSRSLSPGVRIWSSSSMSRNSRWVKIVS